MSHYISEKKHKENLEELGKFAAIALGFLVFASAAFFVNFTYHPRVPWFIAVVIIGSVKIVPRARRLMKKFEDNIKTY
ncbi:MAG: hypothetical protein JKY92_09820 [Magnetovibrio sp.]|nr:hypothetical protein [Magnetovibrio sp.]